MQSKGKFLLGLALAFLGGAVVGLAIGGFGGFSYGTSYKRNEFIYRDAKDVQSQVVILRHLRKEEKDQAIELLENRLDDQLVMFDPVEPFPGLTGREMSEINKGIRASKEYRLAYPRKSKRSIVDEMVRNVFLREPYK